MLQLQAKSIDICLVSKLLVKYNVKASITNEAITLDGDISEKFLNYLMANLEIKSIQNFESEEEKKTSILSQSFPEQELLYSVVKRGEVYWCDFGKPYGHEQGGFRPAIIVQNDEGNLHSPTTIVLCSTTQYKKEIPTHLDFIFSEDTLQNYDPSRIKPKDNTILAEQIRVIDKSRLRKYIGKIKPELMSYLEEKICVSLNLNQQN